MLEERLTCLSSALSGRSWRIEETTRMFSVGYISVVIEYYISKLQSHDKNRNFPIIIITKRTNWDYIFIIIIIIIICSIPESTPVNLNTHQEMCYKYIPIFDFQTLIQKSDWAPCWVAFWTERKIFYKNCRKKINLFYDIPRVVEGVINFEKCIPTSQTCYREAS